MSYPQGTRINNTIGQHSLVSDLAAAAMNGSARSRNSSADGRPRLRPQSVTWADGFIRHTSNILGRFQLTPKASSFTSAGPAPNRGPLTFGQQMNMVRGYPSSPSCNAPVVYPR